MNLCGKPCLIYFLLTWKFATWSLLWRNLLLELIEHSISFRYEDDDDDIDNMEASYSQIEKEELRRYIFSAINFSKIPVLYNPPLIKVSLILSL